MTGESPAEPSSPFDSYRLDYDEVLNRGLAVSGEDAGYFARRRIEWLARCLAAFGAPAASILDYGCGHGTSAPLLNRSVPPVAVGVHARCPPRVDAVAPRAGRSGWWAS